MKIGAYIVNLNQYKLIGTHWVALYASDNSVTYFDRFGAEHILEEIKGYWQQQYHNKYLQNTDPQFY